MNFQILLIQIDMYPQSIYGYHYITILAKSIIVVMKLHKMEFLINIPRFTFIFVFQNFRTISSVINVGSTGKSKIFFFVGGT